MAEGLLLHWIDEHDLTGSWEVASAGVHAFAGVPALGRAQQAMAERGIDISSHRSQPTTRELLETYDSVIVMEKRHQQILMKQYPDMAERVYLIRELAGKTGDVEDPVGGRMDEFRDTADELQGLVDIIFKV